MRNLAETGRLSAVGLLSVRTVLALRTGRLAEKDRQVIEYALGYLQPVLEGLDVIVDEREITENALEGMAELPLVQMVFAEMDAKGIREQLSQVRDVCQKILKGKDNKKDRQLVKVFFRVLGKRAAEQLGV